MEQTQKVGKYTIEVKYSEYPPDSPRNWDNAWKFMFTHKRFYMPNETDIRFDDYYSWDELENALKESYLHVIPVWMFDHSGLSFGIGNEPCPWDSGQIGFAVLSETDFDEFELDGMSDEQLIEMLIEDLDVFERYVNGVNYEYAILDEHGEILDSCTGYYKPEHAMQVGVEDAEWLVKQDEKKAWEKFMAGVSAGLN